MVCGGGWWLVVGGGGRFFLLGETRHSLTRSSFAVGGPYSFSSLTPPYTHAHTHTSTTAGCPSFYIDIHCGLYMSFFSVCVVDVVVVGGGAILWSTFFAVCYYHRFCFYILVSVCSAFAFFL